MPGAGCLQTRVKQCGCRTWAGFGASLRLSHCPGEQSLLLPDTKGSRRAGSRVTARSPGLGEWRKLGNMGGFHSPLLQGCSEIFTHGALHPKIPPKKLISPGSSATTESFLNRSLTEQGFESSFMPPFANSCKERPLGEWKNRRRIFFPVLRLESMLLNTEVLMVGKRNT